jgi:hypothetical protein
MTRSNSQLLLLLNSILMILYIIIVHSAYPAEDPNSGVISFLINQEGTLFEKDFGNKTSDLPKAVTEFNPDGTWAPVGSLAQN